MIWECLWQNGKGVLGQVCSFWLCFSVRVWELGHGPGGVPGVVAGAVVGQVVQEVRLPQVVVVVGVVV